MKVYLTRQGNFMIIERVGETTKFHRAGSTHCRKVPKNFFDNLTLIGTL